MNLIHLIKNELSNKTNIPLVGNFFSQIIIVIMNIFITILIIPYLSRNLGPHSYGIMGFATTIMTFILIIIDYSFPFTGVSKIAKHQNDFEFQKKIFTIITIIKLLLGTVAFAILLIITNSIERFQVSKSIFYYSFGTIIFAILNPAWLFRGLEKLNFLAIIYVAYKVIYSIIVFFIVNNPDDLLRFMQFSFFNDLAFGFLSQLFVFRVLKISYIKISFKDIKHELISGKPLFYSKLSTSLLNSLKPIILGIYSTYFVYGIFFSAFQIYSAIIAFSIIMIAEVLFPRINQRLVQNPKETMKLMYLLIILFFFLGLFLNIFVFLFSNRIIQFLFGPEFTNSVEILKILSFSYIFISLKKVLQELILIPLGYIKEILKINVIISIFGFILLFIMIPLFQSIGLSITIIIIEIFSAALTISIILKKYQNIHKRISDSSDRPENPLKKSMEM